jgi:glycosyltransferase involved in cell wall biosynthesis
MSSSPLVSLVMPVWRPRREWLLEAVRSSLDQPGTRIELIVVDDGNPDPVAPLLDGIDDRRLRIIRIEHAGESAARNAGMAEARGEWLRFIDADDVVAPASTARLLHLAGSDARVITYGATAFCDAALRPVWVMRSRVEGSATVSLLLGRWAVRVPSVLLPRHVAEEAGPWDTAMTISPDWDFLLRAVEHAPVRGCRAIVYYYRRHPDSAIGVRAGSSRPRPHAPSPPHDPARSVNAAVRVATRYFDRHPDQRGTGLERRSAAATSAHAVIVNATQGAPAAAWRAAGASLRADPLALAAAARQWLPAVLGHARYGMRVRRGLR